MNCAQARISLGVYVLGALEPAERAAVDAHLAGCEACRAELAGIEELPALLASVSEEAVAALANGWPHEPTTLLEPNDSRK
jgi:anti-sigma factor RsiW